MEIEMLAKINSECRNTMVENMGIEFVGIGQNWLAAQMPIDARTIRPGNYLHGGSIMALAETVGSGLSYICVVPEEFNVFGIEINGNHIHRAEGKFVTARAQFIHKGKTTHVVNIEVHDENGNLVSICRITNIIVPKNS